MHGIFNLLDLSAAFDAIVQNMLIGDLETIGIKGEVLELMRYYTLREEYIV